jgi:hypothetical protein
MSMQLLLMFLRSSLALRLLNGRPLLWIDQEARENYAINIGLILAALVNSRHPRYSERLLGCLAVIPRDVLEAHPSLRSYFLNSQLGCKSVYDAIKTCQEAIRLSFSAA